MTEIEMMALKILEARENRVIKQRKMVEEYKSTIVSFSMNIPGPNKDSDLYRSAFDVGVENIKRALATSLLKEEIDYLTTGSEAIFAVDEEAMAVKKLMLEIENKHDLGRFFDIDVLDSHLKGISRSDVGVSKRPCYICKKEANICRREGNHSLEELIEFINCKCKIYLKKDLANLAVKALMYEVSASPKPGLVDRLNNGSHTDMTFFTFLESAFSMSRGFEQIVDLAETIDGEVTPDFLGAIRSIGIEMEEGMFKATGHVNAHKGALFTLALTVFASAYSFRIRGSYDHDYMRQIIMAMTRGLTDELKQAKDPVSHGEILYKDHGILGIRGEAEAGYPNVFEKALPYLFDNRCEDKNALMINTLFVLMTSVDDSNILWRQDVKTLNEVKVSSEAFLSSGGMFSKEGPRKAKEIDENFTRRRISPGGSADLLSMTLFLAMIVDKFK